MQKIRKLKITGAKGFGDTMTEACSNAMKIIKESGEEAKADFYRYKSIRYDTSNDKIICLIDVELFQNSKIDL